MPAKIIFDNKNEIPEHLQSQATETDGKWELDAKGVLSKNKELLGKNATLQTKLEEAEAAKEAAAAQAAEWKGKAKIPSGQKLVPADVAELGEAAKAASLSKDEIPVLKTDLDALKTEKARSSRNETRAKAAAAAGFNAEKFTKLAESEDFDVESETVTENGKQTEKFFARTGDVKTPFGEFVEKHDKFSLVLDALKGDGQKQHTPFPQKEKPAEGNLYDRIRNEVEESSKTEKVDVGARFGRPETV